MEPGKELQPRTPQAWGEKGRWEGTSHGLLHSNHPVPALVYREKDLHSIWDLSFEMNRTQPEDTIVMVSITSASEEVTAFN